MCFVSVKRQCEEKEQKLSVLEENLSSTQKEVTELRSCLREVERSRLEARRELQELRRQVRHAVISLTSEQNLGNMLHTVLPLNVNFPFVWLQLKVLDGEKEQKEREVAELQTRLSLEEQRDEERGKEVFTLKQKLAEAETARESLKKEVRMEQSEEISSSLLILLSSVCHCCLFCLFLC